MKQVTLKWIRTALVGSVSVQAPKGIPFILSYLSECQRAIQSPPRNGFASPEGIRQLKVGMILDSVATAHSERIAQFVRSIEAAQRQVSLLQAKAARESLSESEQATIEAMRFEVWDTPLPDSISIRLEDEQHRILVEKLEHLTVTVPTLAVREMINEIKAAPSADVEETP